MQEILIYGRKFVFQNFIEICDDFLIAFHSGSPAKNKKLNGSLSIRRAIGNLEGKLEKLGGAIRTGACVGDHGFDVGRAHAAAHFCAMGLIDLCRRPRARRDRGLDLFLVQAVTQTNSIFQASMSASLFPVTQLH